MSAPSTYVEGAQHFGNTASTIYREDGAIVAGSYALTSWNVGAIWSGAANIDLATGEPVGDWFQRGTVISGGVANTAGIAAGGLSLATPYLPAAAAAPAAPPVLPRPGQIIYGALDDLGRPTGASATLTQDMLGTGTRASQSITPPGFQGGAAGQARGHLVGAQLGGSGSVPQNLVTILQNPANTPVMRGIENATAAAVRAGQTVNYSSVPIYQGVNAIPRGITIISSGSEGHFQAVTVLNPIR
jgi:hypothetical protein